MEHMSSSFGFEVGPENWKLCEAFEEDVEREENNAERVKANTDGLVDHKNKVLGDDVLSGVRNQDKETLKQIEDGNECVDNRDLIKGEKIASVPSPNTSMGSIRQAELRNKILHFPKNQKHSNSTPEYCSNDNQPGLNVDVRSLLGVVLVPVQPVVQADPPLHSVSRVLAGEHH